MKYYIIGWSILVVWCVMALAIFLPHREESYTTEAAEAAKASKAFWDKSDSSTTNDKDCGVYTRMQRGIQEYVKPH